MTLKVLSVDLLLRHAVLLSIGVGQHTRRVTVLSTHQFIFELFIYPPASQCIPLLLTRYVHPRGLIQRSRSIDIDGSRVRLYEADFKN